MARKKKNRGGDSIGPPSGGPRRMSISIEEAENGYTINCSGSGKNGEYHSKSYVAPNERGAIRLATQSLSGIGTKTKGKKGKKGKAKIAVSKRS